MSAVMIPVEADVLSRLQALRAFDGERYDSVLRRVLPRSSGRRSPRYELLGETRPASNATEVMIKILRELAQYDDQFLAHLAIRVRGRTRNHLARTQADVYPGRPRLMRYVKPLAPGWFIGCNISNHEKRLILRAACAEMGLAFGKDLRAWLSG